MTNETKIKRCKECGSLPSVVLTASPYTRIHFVCRDDCRGGQGFGVFLDKFNELVIKWNETNK